MSGTDAISILVTIPRQLEAFVNLPIAVVVSTIAGFFGTRNIDSATILAAIFTALINVIKPRTTARQAATALAALTKGIRIDALSPTSTAIAWVTIEVSAAAKGKLVTDALTGPRYTGSNRPTGVPGLAVAVVVASLQTKTLHTNCTRTAV